MKARALVHKSDTHVRTSHKRVSEMSVGAYLKCWCPFGEGGGGSCGRSDRVYLNGNNLDSNLPSVSQYLLTVAVTENVGDE